MRSARRPIKARSAGWAKGSAVHLRKRGITPNEISITSVLFSLCAALSLSILAINSTGTTWRIIGLVLAAIFIQLRLICNLLDGLVAVEGGLKTPTGEIYNDLPDRISDSLILIALGYAVGTQPAGVILGWLAAILAMFTAYIRVLGASAGAGHFFLGPMAKQHRMAVTTIACVLASVELLLTDSTYALYISLCLIVIGCVVTAVRRLMSIMRELQRNVE